MTSSNGPSAAAPAPSAGVPAVSTPAVVDRNELPDRIWTLPNALSLLRLLGVPLFLWLLLGPEADGWAVIVLGLAGLTDWADGKLARVLGQWSRLGALLDPVVDRLLVVAGVVVCWRFDLLPRWALAVLVARELAVVALARYGLRHGVDLKINWPGRLAVWPVMSAIVFALIDAPVLAEVLLYLGLALALVALAMYLREGMAALRNARVTPSSSA